MGGGVWGRLKRYNWKGGVERGRGIGKGWGGGGGGDKVFGFCREWGVFMNLKK